MRVSLLYCFNHHQIKRMCYQIFTGGYHLEKPLSVNVVALRGQVTDLLKKPSDGRKNMRVSLLYCLNHKQIKLM